MTEFKASLCANTFRKVALAQSTEETRYYLNGVLVEPHEDGGAILVATNGHFLIIMRDKDATVEGPASIVRIRPDILRECHKTDRISAKSKLGRKLVVRGQTARLEKASGNLDFGGSPDEKTIAYQWCGALIDGQFPDWRKVVPKPATQAPAVIPSVNSDYLAAIGKALATETTAGTRLVYCGEGEFSPMLVYPLNKFVDGFGVIMPVRGDDVSMPSWVNLPTGAGEQKAAA